MNEILSSILAEFKKSEKLIEKFTHDGELSRIEFDILMSKLQFVYDALYHYNSDVIIEKIQKPIEHLDKAEGNKLEKKTLPTSDDSSILELSADDTQKDSLHTKDNTNTIHKEAIHDKNTKEQKTILAEKFKQNQPQINELLTRGQHKKDMSTLMQSKPVQNLETAIGINEKFIFTRELFNGDSETYNKTIHILNNSANFNEAFNYIHQTFLWDLENPTTQKLLELIRRKFIASEE